MVSAASIMRRFFVLPATCCLAVLAAGRTHALDIRNYSAARHDRFTGFPSAPVMNTGSWFNGGLYTGVGWSVAEPNRQFALVSPRHFVLPSHWGVTAGTQLRFLGADGQLHTYTVDSTAQISENGTPTDLTLGRLTQAVPLADGVAPLPYLKLNSESLYRNKSLQVFGFNARVGGGTIAAIGNLDLGNGTVSRMYRFDYTITSGGQDDCYFVTGDSGSPSCVIASNGRPALTGTHSAVDTVNSPTLYSNYDTFVPHYVTQLNALMANDGWQMIPSDAAANTLTCSAASSPATLRQANAGSATFTVQNAANAANNLRMSLTFPVGFEPSSITASGWIADQSGPQTWSFHLQSLAASAAATLTANWTSVPTTSSLPVQVTTQSDGSTAAISTFTFAPAPSFAAWSAGLAQAGPADDPDGDGQTNMQEYAFGGDPSNGAAVNAAGLVVRPTVTLVDSSHIQLRYPVRTDSSARGLWYKPEYSQTLTNDWTETAPAGTTVAYQAYAPDVPGFVEARVTVPVVAGRQFVRVKVLLDESAPGMIVP